jgi:hypothetical protein
MRTFPYPTLHQLETFKLVYVFRYSLPFFFLLVETHSDLLDSFPSQTGHRPRSKAVLLASTLHLIVFLLLISV